MKPAHTPAALRHDVALTTSAEPAIVDLLHVIATEIRLLRVAVEQQHRPSTTLTRADRVRLGAILPAVAGARGSDLVTARDLIEHESPALKVALRGFTPKTLGELFRRGAGVPIDRFVIEAVGFEGHARLWKIAATCGVAGKR